MKKILPLAMVLSTLNCYGQEQTEPIALLDTSPLAFATAVAPVALEVKLFDTPTIMDKVIDDMVYQRGVFSGDYESQYPINFNTHPLTVSLYQAGLFLSNDSEFQTEYHRIETGFYEFDPYREESAYNNLVNIFFDRIWDHVSDDGEDMFEQSPLYQGYQDGEQKVVSWFSDNYDGLVGVTLQTEEDPDIKGVGFWDIDPSLRVRPNSVGFRLEGLLEGQEVWRYDARLRIDGELSTKLRFPTIGQSEWTPYIGLDYDIPTQNYDAYIGVGRPIEVLGMRSHLGLRAGQRTFDQFDDDLDQTQNRRDNYAGLYITGHW